MASRLSNERREHQENKTRSLPGLLGDLAAFLTDRRMRVKMRRALYEVHNGN
jgi:hypothetical protein